jgi:hypothetical protein
VPGQCEVRLALHLVFVNIRLIAGMVKTYADDGEILDVVQVHDILLDAM